jgi:hypothetical protein
MFIKPSFVLGQLPGVVDKPLVDAISERFLSRIATKPVLLRRLLGRFSHS